ncbi:hypothetical protein BN7_2558 [Wickerhamomyces ciferrii]|uniref:Protein DIA2 n=1 Tax=Wickerhamomyces ciferrii (strain ATCC 14091 / BCRC 22168 / CBS 111 / JCM 3599 / NBRC 0793 / NRRL Y-1031 F-60-10) TaxID=1206466 RepID=K0KJ61_WICCF|nr:uncharacterized protein BN7_2558 [Wickerhamomyces ciferrii]CCH43011.1 hypothetical protein BN7_2558 [Wickerhamomyces ciferrii]
MSDVEDVVGKALEIGNKQFKLRKYEDAIKLYTKALQVAHALDQKTIIKLRVAQKLKPRPAYLKDGDKVNHPKLTTILDSRAAAYEKTDNLRLALDDSVKAVSFEPYNAKGYIRTGKILIMMKKDKKAFDTFTKGIERINRGIEKFGIQVNPNMLQYLKEQKQKLENKLDQANKQSKSNTTSPIEIKTARKMLEDPISSQDRKRLKKSPSASTSTLSQSQNQSNLQSQEERKQLDPLIWLPLELTTEVFSLLNLKDIIRSFTVSRLWCETLSRSPLLLNDIVIPRFATLKHVQSCFELLTKSRRSSSIKSLNSLQMRSIRRMDERQIMNIVLNKSPLIYTGSLNFNFLDITTEQLVECLQGNRSSLKRLERLKNLRITCVMIPKAEEKLLDLLPHLESLEITRAPDNNRPSSFKKYDIILQRYKNLKTLTLVGDLKQKYPSIPFSNLFTTRVSLIPNLTSLTIVGYDFNTLNNTNVGFNFLQNVPNVQSLVFENNDNFNLATFLKSHDLLEFKNLRKLAIREKEVRYSEHLLNIDSFYLYKIFGKLKILDLTGSSISFQGLGKILRVCGNSLIQLSIGYCQNIIFKKGPFRVHINGGFFDFDDFFEWCPNLQVLYLNQATDFGDYAITQMVSALKEKKVVRHMKLLDLSFNEASGYKLLELLQYLTPQNLYLHGMDINAGTLKLMNTKFGINVESRIDKASWREFGLNSYNPY